MLVKDSLKTPQPSLYDAESTHPTSSVAGSIDGSRAHEEGLHSISLSSEEEDDLTVHREEDEYMMDGELGMGPGSSHTFERRADKFKRSSLKKVDSLKKAFSRQSIEKKVTQITTKIVPPEKREKIKKSLTPNHPKSPSAKSSSFKVSPMTFNVKKKRDGEAISPGEEAHVEIPPLECLDGEIPLAEVHTQEGLVEEIREALSPSTPDSVKAELTVNGEASSISCEMLPDRSAGLAVPEHVDDVGEDEEEQDEGEQLKSHVEAKADVQTPTAAIAVEQVS